ncbi:FAD-binding oxidoreductase [Aspergillus homomorphus CBS 101889]|uniref:FAD-binding domain-containing protein n=1 Tax=Aspergillus homomorphus (strain CBS 101889) TaxID=1450537 RepID=A0A395HHE9_ASPHC|nr:FAD-binding domain-containing protein [Aspergillus homomorphus CBS 101889]RAL06923.1 FAD-binding domain-containing protein [Aspergillus homomorphus CBS 101889]
MTEGHLAKLRYLLRADEIITPDSPGYQASSQTWAAHKHAKPSLVIRPTSIEALSRALAYLYTTDLDFAIYGQGFGSASAKDVLVNTSAFNNFHFDAQAEVVTVGAGQTWSDVYQKLAEAAPEYGVVGARTPCVGVAGTIVCGGYSWVSSEHGCISDPNNMLDTQVVKYDGSIVWASKEPQLLWALRGGGGGFGVITQVKLRVFPYPQKIWAGPILVPRERLQEVAEGIESFLSKPVDPKITMFLYVVKGRLLESIGTNSNMLVIHAFDANGEEHGRSCFKWALEIPGAVDQSKITTLSGVANLQNKAGMVKGSMKQFWQPLLLKNITKEHVINAVQWFEGIREIDAALGDCTYLIFELLSSCDPVGGISSCAWPRAPEMKHILLLGTGCPAGADASKEHLARVLAIKAPAQVLGTDADLNVLPNGLENYHDVTKIWGAHVTKLQDLRKRYDPRRRFKGALNAPAHSM